MTYEVINIFQPPLIQSIFAGDVEEIKVLLNQHQQDVNAQGIIICASSKT